MLGGGAGMSRSPAEISFLEFTICTVAGSPLRVTRAVPRNTASNPRVLWLSGSTSGRPARNGGYRLRCQGLSVDARQKLYPFFCNPKPTAAAGIAETQLRRRYAAVEDEDIPRGDVVRVSDLLLVHTPDFRPAPLIVEEFGGDAPKRIAPLNDVAVRRRILYLQIALCKHQQPRAREREC